MYFAITAGSTAQYLRMSEMSLGSADPNGLKWMAISACNSLYQPNWFNMVNYGVSPYNGNLHLLLGTDSVSWTNPHIESYWARYMTRGKVVLTPMAIQDAWFTASRDAYAEIIQMQSLMPLLETPLARTTCYKRTPFQLAWDSITASRFGGSKNV